MPPIQWEPESQKPLSEAWISSPTKTSRPIVERLRVDGFTVHAIAERNAGAPDADVLTAAEQGRMILITQDKDFGELAILRQLPVVGVVLLEVARLPLKAQVERVAQLIAADHASFAGNLTVVEPGRTRLRPLPDRNT